MDMLNLVSCSFLFFVSFASYSSHIRFTLGLFEPIFVFCVLLLISYFCWCSTSYLFQIRFKLGLFQPILFLVLFSLFLLVFFSLFSITIRLKVRFFFYFFFVCLFRYFFRHLRFSCSLLFHVFSSCVSSCL